MDFTFMAQKEIVMFSFNLYFLLKCKLVVMSLRYSGRVRRCRIWPWSQSVRQCLQDPQSFYTQGYAHAPSHTWCHGSSYPQYPIVRWHHLPNSWQVFLVEGRVGLGAVLWELELKKIKWESQIWILQCTKINLNASTYLSQ